MARRRKRRRRRRSGRPWFLLIAAVLLFGLGYWFGGRWGWRRLQAPQPPSPAAGERRVPERPPARPSPEVAVPPEKVGAPAGRVALVIDDLGRSLVDLDRLEALGVPISYSVLPFESRTPEVVSELQRRGAEILCHLPMQAANGANPGPGALRRDMSRAALVAGTEAALTAVPGAVGVNNHMGSSVTPDRATMEVVLGVLVRHRMFYLDSRTSADSVGYRVALDLGLPAAERQVFLDPEQTVSEVRHQFRRLLELARERGAAIAIGHPHPVTFRILDEEVPRALAAGYEFVRVSYLLDRGGLPRG